MKKEKEKEDHLPPCVAEEATQQQQRQKMTNWISFCVLVDPRRSLCVAAAAMAAILLSLVTSNDADRH